MCDVTRFSSNSYILYVTIQLVFMFSRRYYQFNVVDGVSPISHQTRHTHNMLCDRIVVSLGRCFTIPPYRRWSRKTVWRNRRLINCKTLGTANDDDGLKMRFANCCLYVIGRAQYYMLCVSPSQLCSYVLLFSASKLHTFFPRTKTHMYQMERRCFCGFCWCSSHIRNSWLFVAFYGASMLLWLCVFGFWYAVSWI